MCNNKEKYFVSNLLDTNRGFNYYVNWDNLSDYKRITIELSAMDCLIKLTDDAVFKTQFYELLNKLPSVILTFPYLFALSKAERNFLLKSSNNKLKIIGSELDSDDFQTYSFSKNDTLNMTSENLDKYYNFFEQMGLKDLFQSMLNKSTIDYVIGVLVGLDSNGRKNRGGDAFELACEPIIQQISTKYNLKLLTQKKFKVLKPRIKIFDDVANRKADFILHNDNYSKVLNIEVNFYNGGGSKPEEIVDAYINRQKDLEKNNINFALITDGACWQNDTNQLKKAFRHLDCIANFKMLKENVVESYVKKIFKNG